MHRRDAGLVGPRPPKARRRDVVDLAEAKLLQLLQTGRRAVTVSSVVEELNVPELLAVKKGGRCWRPAADEGSVSLGSVRSGLDVAALLRSAGRTSG